MGERGSRRLSGYYAANPSLDQRAPRAGDDDVARSKSSSRWLQEHFSDPYVKRAQAEGWRSRAVFKLDELIERAHEPSARFSRERRGEIVRPIPIVVWIRDDFVDDHARKHTRVRVAGRSVRRPIRHACIRDCRVAVRVHRHRGVTRFRRVLAEGSVIIHRRAIAQTCVEQPSRIDLTCAAAAARQRAEHDSDEKRSPRRTCNAESRHSMILHVP